MVVRHESTPPRGDSSTVQLCHCATVQQSRPVAPRTSWHAVSAGFLGWTLDAFDFFVVVFLFDVLAKEFHVSKTEVIATTTATLFFRPFGAILFGASGSGRDDSR